MQYYFSFNCQSCKLSYMSSWVPSVPHVTNRTKVSPGQMCLVPLGEFPKCQLQGKKMSLVTTPGLQDYGRPAPLDPLAGSWGQARRLQNFVLYTLSPAYLLFILRTNIHCVMQTANQRSPNPSVPLSVHSHSSPASHPRKKEVSLLSSPWAFISLPFHLPLWDTDLEVNGRSWRTKSTRAAKVRQMLAAKEFLRWDCLEWQSDGKTCSWLGFSSGREPEGCPHWKTCG